MCISTLHGGGILLGVGYLNSSLLIFKVWVSLVLLDLVAQCLSSVLEDSHLLSLLY